MKFANIFSAIRNTWKRFVKNVTTGVTKTRPYMCCDKPMVLIKATTGTMCQGGPEFGGPPVRPMREYECSQCGARLWERVV